MGRLTSAWTDRHVAVALALAAAAAMGAVAMAEPAPYDVVVGVLLLLAAAAGLSTDPFGGIVSGLAAAAVAVAAKQLGGAWSPSSFATSVVTTLGLLVLGWVCGLAGGRLRTRRGDSPADPGAAGSSPAFGSLGLLTAEYALPRLEDEMARARRHGRPLAVLLVRMYVTDDSLDDRARRAARRSVARLLESLLRETDVPFALTPEEIGAILPETDTVAAWDIAGPVIEAASHASFTDRETGDRRGLADSVELHASLVALTDDLSRAEDLLRAARAALDTEETTDTDAATDAATAAASGPGRPAADPVR